MDAQERSIETLIDDTRIMIQNSLNQSEIKVVVNGIGYNETALHQAESLNTQADAKYLECRHKIGEQIEATRNFQGKFREEVIQYLDYRKLAKRTLRGKKYEGLREKLGIESLPRRTISGFIEDALRFYHGAINSGTIMERLGTFSITMEKLQERLTGIAAMKVLDEKQEAVRGIVQVLREERDKLCEELRIWKSDFKIAVRIAFKDNPQYMEILRIKPIAPRTIKKTPPVLPPTGTTAIQTVQSAENTQGLNQTTRIQAAADLEEK